MTQLDYPYRPTGEDQRSAAGMMSDFDAVAAIINGGLDASNLTPGALGWNAIGVGAAGLAQYSFKWHRSIPLNQNRGDNIVFDAEAFDYGNYTPDTAFEAPLPGVWAFSWRFGLDNLINGDYFVESVLTVNGTDAARGSYFRVAAGDQTNETCSVGSTVMQLALGASVSLRINWASAELMTVSGGEANTFLAGFLVGRT